MDASTETRMPMPTSAPFARSNNALLTSEQILRGSNEVRIVHGGCVYSLRLTRQGKLILTK
ncbi:MAG TPA: hemin uptake protein HemP [Rhodocyclaceae bacterium]|nr:hemin uptake protein HemP [Rhodocyclaceae bacterium]